MIAPLSATRDEHAVAAAARTDGVDVAEAMTILAGLAAERMATGPCPTCGRPVDPQPDPLGLDDPAPDLLRRLVDQWRRVVRPPR
jgi:hypothetical protein